MEQVVLLVLRWIIWYVLYLDFSIDHAFLDFLCSWLKKIVIHFLNEVNVYIAKSLT